jgi:hypothetical protein
LNHGHEEAIFFEDSHEEKELDHSECKKQKSQLGQIKHIIHIVLDILLIKDGNDQEDPELGEVCDIPSHKVAQPLFFKLSQFDTKQDRGWHHCGHIHPELKSFALFVVGKESYHYRDAEHENIHRK